MSQTTSLIDLKSLNRDQLQKQCAEWGLPRFRADQIFQWLYQKQIHSVEEMTNLSKQLREELTEKVFINL